MARSFILAAFPCIFFVLTANPREGSACTTPFDGFGVHLGGMHHFNSANEEVMRTVIDKLYFELQLRHFRTSYEPYMSPAPDVYDIRCHDPEVVYCTWSWEALLSIISEPRYQNPRPTFIASIWSPPYYMKDMALVRLKKEYEPKFLDFIRNVTAQIHEQFGIVIERVSPVNEPENVFAPWDHCNMDPMQLCRMVRDFNDSLVATCTENSYYWITELYMSFRHPTQKINCWDSCDIISTHAYALNLDVNSPNFLLAYYDLVPYEPKVGVMAGKRIWQTEVSSTYYNAIDNQMGEALDLAVNIVNFVGTTCVERYYFWLAFTVWTSGESLIWGHKDENEPMGWRLEYPKKYFVYNHFTKSSTAAAAVGDVIVQRCTEDEFLGGDGPPLTTCLRFNEKNVVFVNREIFSVNLNTKLVDCSEALCCTTAESDNDCDASELKNELPPQSICRCQGAVRGPGEDSGTSGLWTTKAIYIFTFTYILAKICLNFVAY